MYLLCAYSFRIPLDVLYLARVNSPLTSFMGWSYLGAAPIAYTDTCGLAIKSHGQCTRPPKHSFAPGAAPAFAAGWKHARTTVPGPVTAISV